jgi:hypothetical protein
MCPRHILTVEKTPGGQLAGLSRYNRMIELLTRRTLRDVVL